MQRNPVLKLLAPEWFEGIQQNLTKKFHKYPQQSISSTESYSITAKFHIGNGGTTCGVNHGATM